MRTTIAALLLVVTLAQPAAAIPAKNRVSMLKYYQCLGQKIFYPYLVCHL